MGEQPRVHVVLGVEDPDHLAGAVGQRGVERPRLVLLLVRVLDHEDAAGVALGHALRHGARGRIVVADDHDELEVRVIDRTQASERLVEHSLLVPRRDDERERVLGVTSVRVEAGPGERGGRPPRVKHPCERGRRDRHEGDRDERIQDV